MCSRCRVFCQIRPIGGQARKAVQAVAHNVKRQSG